MTEITDVKQALKTLMQFCTEQKGKCSKCPFDNPCDDILGLSLKGLAEDMLKRIEK